MILARAIRDGAEALSRTEFGSCTETPQSLFVKGIFTEEILAQWCQISADLEGSGIGGLIALDSLGNDVDLRGARIEDLTDEIRLFIEKERAEGEVRLFLPASIQVLLENQDESRKARFVYIADEFAPFSTISCSFSPWVTVTSPTQSEQSPNNVDPRKFVRDLTGTGAVPRSIGIYVLKEEPEQTSEVFQEWSDTASRYLPLCLVDEVWDEDGTRMISLVGPRTRRMPLGNPSSGDTEFTKGVQSVSDWIFSNSRDVEIRHTLFTNELAREWPEAVGLCEQFSVRAPRALDSAITAYRAHLREQSKETLRSLGDLRKALSEEVSKVSSQTRELIGILWRDFAIAMAALLSRVALLFADKRDSADSLPMKTVLFATAMFLVVDLAITLKTNARFMRLAAESRSVWRRKLYGFLTDDDVKLLADVPIQESLAAYNQAKWIIVGIYGIVVLVLLNVTFPALLNVLSNSTEDVRHLLIHSTFR